MASFEGVQLLSDSTARSKVLDQIKAEVDKLRAVNPGALKGVDQHAKVNVHLKSGANPGSIVERT